MSLRSVASGLNILSSLEFNSLPLSTAADKGGEIITVTMRGQTPAAHADAILEHYKFTKTDEAKFKELYGFDLRQDLTAAYAKKDNKAAHTALGKGLYRVEVPIPKELLSQIRTVKDATQQPAAPPQDSKQVVAEKNGYDQSAALRAQIEGKLPSANSAPLPSGVPVPAPAPTPLADKSEYTSLDKVELPTTPENASKLTITIQTFIPMEHVDGPNNPFVTPTAPALGNFEGDGRDVDQRTVIKDGELNSATYRTKQEMIIDFAIPEGVDVPCQTFGQSGVSKDLSRWNNRTPLRRDRATGETIQATARREGNTITIEARGDESNPLVYGAPPIDYKLQIKIERQPDGTMKMTTNGTHDGFPGYEMFVSRPGAAEADKKLVYGFDPRKVGNTPLDLMDSVFGQRPVVTKTVIAPAIVTQPAERKQQ